MQFTSKRKAEQHNTRAAGFFNPMPYTPDDGQLGRKYVVLYNKKRRRC
jgi:hypothetical protein